MSYVYTTMESPIGVLKLIGSDRGLSAVLWEHEDSIPAQFGELAAQPHHPLLCQARQQLEEYFAGTRTRFTVKLDLAGTRFQNSVWNALRTIPFGETRSYAQIAGQIGRAKAVRAVGAANGRNPIPIIVPCHRVIGADGSLTGFAGGLGIKARLLALEGGSVSPRSAQLALGV
ncbi:MAG TPA: methylated-DNA--[protein]-cysteine S-methyltransferase [Steroidobacteraceae bacterium]|nr:methylated-DNA--[protein]-cysteine S-methyltransferase [Steroidobacteraceae bacterium]